ncbi:carbonic anhydrase 1 [Halyomorpha halys]|uniref:carbonic anhydrase 1 n=1 Tax=Halyomorpha halys TaxID=286706 RepID=UPI0006D4F9C8
MRKWTTFKHDATPLELINYDQEVPVTVTVDQSHFTVMIVPDPNSRIAISGGGLRGTYVLQQAHFHFGSEHLIDSQRYALEAHLVHFREIYGNRSEPALNDPEGIAVLGSLFCLSKKNSNLQKVIEGANGQDIKLNFRDFLPDDLDFYRYYGSLTTPPCSESVVWTLFKNRASISKLQLDNIKSMFPEKVHSTYRNVQGLNGRDVERWEFNKEFNKVNFLKSSPNLLVAAPILAHNVHGIF